MLRLARGRGVQAVRGVGERLPFAAASFDTVLVVAVVAFLSDPIRAFRQAHRVLLADGALLVGVIDRGSPLWPEAYGGSTWARGARFRRAVDVVAMLEEAGFELGAARQTIFEPLAEIQAQPAVRSGAGEGLFAVLQALPDGQPQDGIATEPEARGSHRDG